MISQRERNARYHVTILTKAGAEKYTRQAYNVHPDAMLGWTPYRYYVLIDGHTSYFACHKGRDLKSWLSARGFKVGEITRRHPDPASWAVATFWAGKA